MTTTSTDTLAVELTREWVEQQERYARNMAARMRAFCHPAKAAIYDRKAALCRSWLARQDEAAALRTEITELKAQLVRVGHTPHEFVSTSGSEFCDICNHSVIGH